ncbi:MAG: class I SAM-dependent methyltransferase, partial [Candidatus Altiarchaeota archaeon]|nr:class I SAM-dependent methyltransferase [Candidatus Altiarchaeota archaeon]
NIYDPLSCISNSFDAIISIQTIQHGTSSQIKFAIEEMIRVLKPNGFLFITLAGRICKGKIRPCLVKAVKAAPHTYITTNGNEKGSIHFIFNEDVIKCFLSKFHILKTWKDVNDYYCVLAKLESK